VLTRARRGGARVPGILAVGLVLSLVVAACGGSGGDAASTGSGQSAELDMAPVTLKIPTAYGPDHFTVRPLKAYADEVEKQTGGKIKYEFFYGGSLVPVVEHADALADGTADMTMFAAAVTPENFPIATWQDQLGNLPGNVPVVGTLVGMAAKLDWAMNNEAQKDELRKFGIEGLLPAYQLISNYDLLCARKDLSTPEGMNGTRVRVSTAAVGSLVQALGGVPVQLPAGDLFEGMQRGLVDCSTGGWSMFYGDGIIPLGDTLFTAPAAIPAPVHAMLGMSKQTWDALPLKAKQIMWDALPIYLEKVVSIYFQDNLAAVKDLADHNVTIKQLAPQIQDNIGAHMKTVEANMVQKPPPGVSDPQKAIADLTAAHAKWNAIVVNDLKVPELGSWSEVAQQVQEGRMSLDLKGWIAQVKAQILDPNRPQ